MQTDTPNSSACDQAVKRIKHLFSRGKQHFLYSAFLGKCFSHECDHLKFPNLVRSLQKFTVEKQKLKKEKRKQFNASPSAMRDRASESQGTAFSSIAQNQLCSLNQRHPLLLHFEKRLNERVIKNIKHKEYVIAVKNFKKIARQTQDWMYGLFNHQVKVIHEETKNKKNESDQPSIFWEELIKSKEERQFEINRVIKYLSDR